MSANIDGTVDNDDAANAVQGQSVSDERMLETTGKTRGDWHAVLDAAGASAWDHTTIAKWLVTQHGVDGWWAQGITVGFEQARGLRQPGQKADGTYSASVTKTIRAPKAAVLQAVIETISAELGDPTSTNPDSKYATARWSDGDERILASVSQSKPDRVLAGLDRSRMSAPASAATKDALRRWLDLALDTLE